MFLKRRIPILIVIIVGLLTLFGHFITQKNVQEFVDNDATQWFDIIASFSIFLGALILLKLQMSKIIRNKNIKISFDNTPSIFSFNQIDLGISIKSTLMFERIFYGYKTLFYCFKKHDFPIKNSSLNNIFINKKCFNETISKSLTLKTTEFFNHFDLMKYSKYLEE